jgi:hypothetical protein
MLKGDSWNWSEQDEDARMASVSKLQVHGHTFYELFRWQGVL